MLLEHVCVCVCVCVLHGTMCPMMSIFLAHHPPTKVPRDTHESCQPDATQKINTTTARKDMYPHTCTYHGRHLSPHVRIRHCHLQEGDCIYWSSFTQCFPHSILSFISALMSLPFLPFMYFAWHNCLCFSV